MTDKSNGYEEYADSFMRGRHPHIGQNMAREWAREFTPGLTVLELGCGDGVISQVLVDVGLTLYAVDASPGCFAPYVNASLWHRQSARRRRSRLISIAPSME
jgi:2-polyprenyl-3-methyl-5-hydroxy-6-metoxy-1,4-benzoquinol methylase